VPVMPSAAPMRVRLRNTRHLRDAMHFARVNVRELAEMCGSIRHRSTIGHLHSGTRSTCSVALGRRIEERLRLYPGSLFDPVVTTVNPVVTTTPPRKKAA
jgi:hypothetical protein